MDMTPDRWQYIETYSRTIFGREDAVLANLQPAAIAAGLPNIAVSPDVGRLLMMLASTTRGDLALEVGTLGGYSGIWLTRGLRTTGRLITIELEDRHAEFAQRQFVAAGLADRIRIERGAALDVLPRLAGQLGAASTDVVFLDAVKAEYAEYWRLVRPLIRPGGWLLADNALGSDWTIDQENHPTRRAVDAFNRAVASDAEFESAMIPLRNGVLIARRRV